MHRRRKGSARWRRRIVTLVLASLALPIIAPSAQADPLDDLKRAQDALDHLQTERDEISNAYAQTVSEAQEAQLLLQRGQAELAIAQNHLVDVQARLRQSEEALAAVEAELKVAEEEFARRQRMLHTRVRALNEEGRVRYVDVLFGSNSFSDFISRLAVLRVIVTQDAELFKAIRHERQVLRDKRAEAVALRDELANLRALAQVRALEVQEKVEETNRYASLLEQQRRSLLARHEEMDRDEERLREMVAQAQRELARQSGEFKPIWPVRKPFLTDYFHMRWHPITGEYRMHNGIDLDARIGDPIAAVDDGWVLTAGPNGTYGNLVVLDHGNGISTWYAHLSEIDVWVGQEVKVGQQLGKAGNTGWSTGPHLHFEIRKDGTPVDPLDYLPRL